MHYFGTFDDSALARHDVYAGRGEGYRQAPLIGPHTGSVHTGLSVAQLDPGGVLAPHVHSFEEGFYVLEGERDPRRRRRAVRLRAGDYGALKVGTVARLAQRRRRAPCAGCRCRRRSPSRRAPSATRSFRRTRACPPRRRRSDGAAPAGAILGHFDASHVPPVHERQNVLKGLEGVFLKWLIDENVGAAHHRLLFIEYQPGVGIGLHDHTFEEGVFPPQRRGRGHDGRQGLPGRDPATCCGRAWAACTRSATSARRRCGGSKRLLRSRRRRTHSASWRNGKPRRGSWRGRGMTTATTQASSRTRPYTGAEYLESLRDGREIWIYGEKVKDVTTHPAFRNTARMLARLYDALHDPAKKDVLTIADRHRHRRLHAPLLQGDAGTPRSSWPRATRSPSGRA